MPKAIELTLTNFGRMRLARLQDRIIEETSKIFFQGFEKITKERIAKLSPDFHKEADLMTEGGYVEGRFMKVGEFMTIKEAVIQEVPTLKMEDFIVWVDFGDSMVINKRLGFGWLAYKSDFSTLMQEHEHYGTTGEVRRTSDPEAHSFWSTDYIQTWEYGGHITVTPRDPDGFLSPRPGKLVKQVTHSIPSIGMFNKGYASSAHTLRNFIFSELHQKVKNLDRRRAI